ncbi:MAG: hypothetical protein RL033_1875, partial [Pseudomonadota bacterium]
MSVRLKLPALSPLAGWRLARLLVVAGFMLLVGRHWHTFYGFTSFLQIDPLVAADMVPALRDGPVYVHPREGSYDGCYYVQIATSPGLGDPALRTAIDDANYRARRILLGATAWVLGGGEPVRTAHVYAWLNVVLWFGLAVLLWRVFPVANWRATLAWALLLASAGVLFSVRYALTDLAALILTVAAILLVEQRRFGPAAALVGVSGLARETGILGAAIFLADRPANTGAALKLAGRLVLGVLPLVLWLLYVRHAFGGTSAGQRNLAWPLAGWVGRWQELAQTADGNVSPRVYLESFLEHIALSVQAAYLVIRRDKNDPWWWTGASYVLLLICMGHAVWGGYPNAASRVLLPLTLVFNVLVVRRRAALGWLLAGNLSVFAGFQSLEVPPDRAHELPSENTWGSWQMLENDGRWAVAEWNSRRRWAWCAGAGGLTVSVWPSTGPRRLQLEMKGITPRELRVMHHGREIWRGEIDTRP